MRKILRFLMPAVLIAAALLFAGCGPKAVMMNDPSIVLTPTPNATATFKADDITEGSGETYYSAISLFNGHVLAIGIQDYSIAFNKHAAAYGFPYNLPEELGVGDKRTISHEFSSGLTLTFSLSGGWITKIEFVAGEATPGDFPELRAGGIATLLASDPILDVRDTHMILTELGLNDDGYEDIESGNDADTQGSLDYDDLIFSWEITDDGNVIFTVTPVPYDPTPTP